MDIRLKRPVEINSYESIMKIGARKDDFNFYIPILELAHKNGFLNHRAINEELLFKNPENAMGINILEKLINYEFVARPFEGEDVYDLTEHGKEIFQCLRSEDFTSINSQIIWVLERLEFITPSYRVYSTGYDLTEQGRTFIESSWPIKNNYSVNNVC